MRITQQPRNPHQQVYFPNLKDHERKEAGISPAKDRLQLNIMNT